MRQTRDSMGMHVTVAVEDGDEANGCAMVFDYFSGIDRIFSTYKPDSLISKINRGELSSEHAGPEIQEIFRLAEQTKRETNGFFDIQSPGGGIDPSGLVKGWAIWQASLLLYAHDYRRFFVDAGGDIQAMAGEQDRRPWRVGIRNPFHREKIVKVLGITTQGVATSGSAERGQHIYNPHEPGTRIDDIISLTVIGKNIYEADRFATAAFAMGAQGIQFIEKTSGLEGYIIDKNGMATQTSGFGNYVIT